MPSPKTRVISGVGRGVWYKIGPSLNAPLKTRRRYPNEVFGLCVQGYQVLPPQYACLWGFRIRKQRQQSGSSIRLSKRCRSILQSSQRTVRPCNAQTCLSDILHAVATSQLHAPPKFAVQCFKHDIDTVLAIILVTKSAFDMRGGNDDFATHSETPDSWSADLK